jgi:hypothetical protein
LDIEPLDVPDMDIGDLYGDIEKVSLFLIR